VATGAQERSLRTCLLALDVLIHVSVPVTAAVRRFAKLRAEAVEMFPTLADELKLPHWRILCEHVAVRL
jgi:hypothetical protein